MNTKVTKDRYVVFDIPSDANDDELRQLALESDSMNASYITSICRGCGVFAASFDGDTKNAEILKHCRRCVKLD